MQGGGGVTNATRYNTIADMFEIRLILKNEISGLSLTDCFHKHVNTCYSQRTADAELCFEND